MSVRSLLLFELAKRVRWILEIDNPKQQCYNVSEVPRSPQLISNATQCKKRQLQDT